MIRQSVFAGSWYPNDSVLLGRLIERAKEPKEGAFTRFAVLPHAGLSYSAPGIAPFFGSFDRSVTRLLVIAPALCPCAGRSSHHGSLDSYKTPLDHWRAFPEWSKLRRTLQFFKEHSIEMVLPFISGLEHPPKVSAALVNHFSSLKALDEMSDFLLEEDEGLSIIASSDFTHYGPRFGFSTLSEQEVKERDIQVARLLADGKIEEAFSFFTTSRHTICGWASAALVANIAKRKGMKGEVAGYYTSNDIAGRDDGDFVAYATILWRQDEEYHDRLLILAREVLSASLGIGDAPMYELLKKRDDPFFTQKRGVFVTLRTKDGALRGASAAC